LWITPTVSGPRDASAAEIGVLLPPDGERFRGFVL
jgi:hypothetical protein